jgi:glycosyltransferase involved in cell wall biosynthesis
VRVNAVQAAEAAMRLAYFVNQYPAVSHTFIRRELEALEAMGLQVERFALYAQEGHLVDPKDRQELERVHFLLRRNALVFLRDTLLTFLRSPPRFLRTLGLALRQGYGSKSGWLRHLAYLLEACTLQRWLRQLEVSHVHAHFGTNGAQVAMMSRLLGGPAYSFTVHGPEEFDDAPIIALKDKIRHASFVVAISSFGRSQLYRLCQHSHWPRIHVVRCGIPQDYGVMANDADAAGRRLVCVGRLCEQKGQLLLIEAAHRLLRRGIDFEVVLVGDGPMRAELESLIDRYGLSQRVQITGWCSGDEVRQQLLSARALVLPSFAEGLPVVLMEAMAMRRPVITTFIAGIPELVDSDCGWLIPAGSVDHLTEVLMEALRTPGERIREMGRRGAEKVRQHHDVNQEASRLAELFRQSPKDAS